MIQQEGMLGVTRLFLRTPCFRTMCTLVSTTKLNSMINACIEDNNISQARKLLEENPSSCSIGSWNMVLRAYFHRNQIKLAHDLFDQMPRTNAVSWNIMLFGFHKTRKTNGLYGCFLQMGRAGVAPDNYTISMLVTAIIGTELDVLVHQVHALALHLAFNLDVFVGTTLLCAYTSLKEEKALSRVFDDILMKAVSSWNALVSGYMEMGNLVGAQTTFDLMPERDIISWNSLVNGYARNNQIDVARSIFDKMSVRNVVSWNSLISGYVRNERFMDAFKLFVLMLESGTKPNQSTFTSVFDACAGCSSLLMGKQVHPYAIMSGILNEVISLSALMDMYAKSGDMNAAFRVFESIPENDVVSWSSIIGGYARHGLSTRALEEFNRMKEAGFTPNEITFVNVLSACVQAGLIKEGEQHFADMVTKYGIQAQMEHYTCMVDLYGKAGKFDEAENLIKNMPFEPNVVLWSALLAAYALHSNLELGEYTAERIRKLDRNFPDSYLVLSKIQVGKGIWSSANELRDTMKERKVKNQEAISWVE